MAGFGALAFYSATPGVTRAAAPIWPKDSRLHLDPNRTTLVMFVHPWCPCSEASLTELEEVVARSDRPLASQIVFLHPENTTSASVKSSLWHHAKRIPGLSVTQDAGGLEAQRFHAGVSGDTFLFKPDGTLAFRGGITGARGQVGANAGQAAVEDFVEQGQSAVTSTPVFGCPLFDPSDPGKKGS